MNLAEHLALPCLDQVMAKAEVAQDLSIRDNGPANVAADDIMYAVGGETLRLRAPCAAHGVSNAQAFAFCAVSPCISGIIACSLAQRPGGAVAVLRSCIEEVLFRSLHVHRDSEPPDQLDARVQYRTAVFDLCLGHDLQALRRRANLELLLHSDFQSPEVHVYLGGAGVGFDARAWARSVATLLLPRAIELFPRCLGWGVGLK